MKKTIAALFIAAALAPAARAQTFIDYALSTATYSGACVSTSAATQVDMLDHGGALAMSSRDIFVITLTHSDTTNINCGFDANVSTIAPTGTTASPNFGVEMSSPSANGSVVSQYEVALPISMHYWCKAQAAAACQPISVWSGSAFKTGSRTIP